MQEREACEQRQERTDTAPRPVVVGPGGPGFVSSRVVWRVATAQEPAEHEEHRERDAGQGEPASSAAND